MTETGTDVPSSGRPRRRLIWGGRARRVENKAEPTASGYSEGTRLWLPTGPPPVFVNKVSLAHSHAIRAHTPRLPSLPRAAE